MSIEASYIGAYWGRRPESAEDCGERLAGCISDFARINPILGSWYRKGATKEAARTRVEPTADALGKLFAAGVNRGDFGGEAIDELGFSVGLWNRASPAVSLSATAGIESKSGLVNAFVLEFFDTDEDAVGLYEHAAASRIFQSVVDAWEPDWATWTTDGLRNGLATPPRDPVVGWFTYLRGTAAEVLPAGRSMPLAQGALVWARDEFVDVDLAAVGALREALLRASALHPIP